MKVNIEDRNQLIAHILLNDINTTLAVCETKEWKENRVINCEVSFNGLKFDGSVLENTLKHFVDSIEKHFKEKYDAENLDRIIEERAKEIIKEYADNALEKLYVLSNKLEEIDTILVPHWERNKN